MPAAGKLTVQVDGSRWAQAAGAVSATTTNPSTMTLRAAFQLRLLLLQSIITSPSLIYALDLHTLSVASNPFPSLTLS